jgi:hypothetical protein
MTLAIPYAAPMIPVKAALTECLTATAIKMYTPDAIPAPPRPAIALPTINAVLFGETPVTSGKLVCQEFG